jgi:hypothetical protein
MECNLEHAIGGLEWVDANHQWGQQSLSPCARGFLGRGLSMQMIPFLFRKRKLRFDFMVDIETGCLEIYMFCAVVYDLDIPTALFSTARRAGTVPIVGAYFA